MKLSFSGGRYTGKARMVGGTFGRTFNSDYVLLFEMWFGWVQVYVEVGNE